MNQYYLSFGDTENDFDQHGYLKISARTKTDAMRSYQKEHPEREIPKKIMTQKEFDNLNKRLSKGDIGA